MPTDEINITLLSATLGEDISEIVAGGLCDLGYACRVQMFTLATDRLNIVMPAVFFPVEQLAQIPRATIFYNFEDLEHQTEQRQAAMLEILRQGFQVWDFSRQNLAWYVAAGFGSAFRYMPLGYTGGVDHLVRRPWDERYFDVLFYGTLTSHRIDILVGLAAAKLSVGVLANVYGEARNEMISRARIVLNVPTFAARGEHERPRVVFCASNGKLCVSESPAEAIPASWRQAVEFVAPAEIVATCARLVQDRDLLLAREGQAYEAMRAMPMATTLRAALAAIPPRPATVERAAAS